jgi:[ribosomal protein S5]-alanine N-acetyltransferase
LSGSPWGAVPWDAVGLRHGEVTLRPIAMSDRKAWEDVRARNASWLLKWEATRPPGSPARAVTFRGMVRELRRQAKQGRCLPLALAVDGEFAGQVTVNNIVGGSAMFASIGYWIDQRHAGRGHMPIAVALVVDHCMHDLGLHRIEIAIRPENAASLRVVEKLGIGEVGYAPRYLHIDGHWRDHRLFAVTAEEVPGGLLQRYLAGQRREHPESHQ